MTELPAQRRIAVRTALAISDCAPAVALWTGRAHATGPSLGRAVMRAATHVEVKLSAPEFYFVQVSGVGA